MSVEKIIKERLYWCMVGDKRLIRKDIKETVEAIQKHFDQENKKASRPMYLGFSQKTQDIIERLEKENRELREALEYYANYEINTNEDGIYGEQEVGIPVESWLHDKGKKAKSALGRPTALREKGQSHE